MPHRILRLDEVTARTGLSKSTIYSMIRAGSFPRAVALSPRNRGWVEREIDAWIEERLADRDTAPGRGHRTAA